MRQPETKSARLVNSQGRATLHEYSHTERTAFRTPGVEPEPADAFIFLCSETGEPRRWGIE
jgi:hypothetical protein